jgi:peptide/nickel transport system substrate-binding protein
VKPYEYNPQRAKELLTQAGFANGFTIGLDAPIGGNPIKPVEVAQAVAADLEKVGIKAQLRTTDTATYAQMKFGYKLAPILMWNWMAFEADYILYMQAHSKAQFFHYPGHTPEVDRLMEQQRAELNPTRRLAVLKTIQQKMREDAPFLVLYQQKDIFAVNKRLDWTAVPGGYLHLTTIKAR